MVFCCFVCICFVSSSVSHNVIMMFWSIEIFEITMLWVYWASCIRRFMYLTIFFSHLILPLSFSNCQNSQFSEFLFFFFFFFLSWTDWTISIDSSIFTFIDCFLVVSSQLSQTSEYFILFFLFFSFLFYFLFLIFFSFNTFFFLCVFYFLVRYSASPLISMVCSSFWKNDLFSFLKSLKKNYDICSI